MKKNIFLLLFPILLLYCTPYNSTDDLLEAEPSDNLIEGVYNGSFIRSTVNVRFTASEVTITLKDGKFEGTSSTEKYPAICRGTYEISGSEVIFKNDCAWTAEFDWRYILSGAFDYSFEDNGTLRVRRAYNDDSSTVDSYILTKNN